MNLSGLPGVNEATVEAAYFVTPSGAIRLLGKHIAVTKAGSCGAITAWKDDAGQYRAEFHRHCTTKGSYEGTSKKSLAAWLKQWIPILEGDGL